MFQVKLRYLDIYVSNSFQRFPIPHVIWICVRAMFCDKKFHEHFDVLDQFGPNRAQGWLTDRDWTIWSKRGAQASLDPESEHPEV